MRINDTIDAAVIGAGPAGIAAAIQLTRFGLKPILLEKDQIGGLLRNANWIENYPGFPNGLTGAELVGLLRHHVEKMSIEILHQQVIGLDFDGDRFILNTDRETRRVRSVVVASGTRPRRHTALEIPGKFRDRVLYEIYPILRESGKRIAIVGAGDAAFDYALNLSRCNEVVILNRNQHVGCLPLLRQRANASEAITYFENTELLRLAEDDSNQISLVCRRQGICLSISADYLVFAIGREPQLDFLSDRLRESFNKLESDGLIYFAGDVRNGGYRQTAIAVGDGIMAAMRINARLNSPNLNIIDTK